MPENEPGDEETDLENANSWVEIRPPAVGEGEKPYYMIWGRFWGTLDDLTAAFFWVFSPDEIELDTFRLAIFGDYTGLENFDPRMDPDDFESRLMSYSISDAPVPQITLNETRDAIEEELSQEDQKKELGEILSEENEKEFKAWCENLFNSLVEQGGTEFHVRGRATSQESMKSARNTAGQQPTQVEQDEGTTVPVTFINSPMHGVTPPELQINDLVHVRVVGEAVQKLPEHMIDEDKQNRSVPVQSWIHEIDSSPDLPPDFDGNREEYFEITTELDTGIFGKGLIYKNEQIKTKKPEEKTNLKQEEILSLIVLTVLLGIIFMLLVLT